MSPKQEALDKKAAVQTNYIYICIYIRDFLIRNATVAGKRDSSAPADMAVTAPVEKCDRYDPQPRALYRLVQGQHVPNEYKLLPVGSLPPGDFHQPRRHRSCVIPLHGSVLSPSFGFHCTHHTPCDVGLQPFPEPIITIPC